MRIKIEELAFFFFLYQQQQSRGKRHRRAVDDVFRLLITRKEWAERDRGRRQGENNIIN